MSSNSKKLSTRSLVVTAMMIAITAVLSVTPLGLIPLGTISASTIHIPTIIIAILEGPVIGAITGAAMGLISLFRAMTAPSGILDPYFVNPIISVLPRILIGVVAAYSYKLFSKITKKDSLSTGIAALLGSITNTVLVLGLLYIIYVAEITEKLGSAAGPVLLAVATTSGVFEAICTVVISVLLVVAIKKAFPRIYK